MKKHKWKRLNLPSPLGGVCSGMAVWGVGRAGVWCFRTREKPIQMCNALKSMTYLGVRRITNSQLRLEL